MVLKVKLVSTLCRPVVDSPPSDVMFITHRKVILRLIQTIWLVLKSTVWPKLDNRTEVNVPRPIQVP